MNVCMHRAKHALLKNLITQVHVNVLMVKVRHIHSGTH